MKSSLAYVGKKYMFTVLYMPWNIFCAVRPSRLCSLCIGPSWKNNELEDEILYIWSIYIHLPTSTEIYDSCIGWKVSAMLDCNWHIHSKVNRLLCKIVWELWKLCECGETWVRLVEMDWTQVWIGWLLWKLSCLQYQPQPWVRVNIKQCILCSD